MRIEIFRYGCLQEIRDSYQAPIEVFLRLTGDRRSELLLLHGPSDPALSQRYDRRLPPILGTDFYTRHRHTSIDSSSALYEWWNGDLILDGTPESELIPDLLRTDSDPVVLKDTYSAFNGTDLEERLRRKGIEEVMVTGVMTNLCCETTARDAFVRGFRVFFSTDSTATSSSELHEATLKNMAYGFAYLIDRKRLEEAFSK